MSNFKFVCFLIVFHIALWIALWLPWWWSTGIGFFEYWSQLKELFHRPCAEERAKNRIRWFGSKEELRRLIQQEMEAKREPPAAGAPVPDEFPEREIEIEERPAIKK